MPIVHLIGPSGVGKTSIFRGLLGYSFREHRLPEYSVAYGLSVRGQQFVICDHSSKDYNLGILGPDDIILVVFDVSSP